MAILYQDTKYEGVHDRIAHTAEHAFIGALQKILDQTLQVRKVEHKNSGNTAFIIISDLELQTVLDAQEAVNGLIEQGRNITERKFGSMEDAINAYPLLRANKARISGEVRVVEVENHDVAACALEHAGNLRECEFFLVTRLSKNGSEYEVDFLVGKPAKDAARSLSARFMRLCIELGANINTAENTARKLKGEADTWRQKLKSVSLEKLAAIVPDKIGKFSLLTGVFSNLDDDQVVEFAGERTADENVLVLIANVGPEIARVVFARNEKSSDMDCSELFKRVVREDGRGGGKPHFVTGVVKREALDRLMDEMTKEIVKSA
jgi:alanyl-tRNA synthetase